MPLLGEWEAGRKAEGAGGGAEGAGGDCRAAGRLEAGKGGAGKEGELSPTRREDLTFSHSTCRKVDRGYRHHRLCFQNYRVSTVTPPKLLLFGEAFCLEGEQPVTPHAPYPLGPLPLREEGE